ncbi:sigma-E factor negative regulatory protein RseA [Janthinobacterium psychrotolerans]|uniref:Sigma-E factor negative regulatory protein RseA n=2 Tax=Janthinobacterium psychrotolerans TaxID=1747903 RepID=A0A1A7C451_9BURK|nr:sigma-E factor negative regulatory protein RseA [Janthinobacterium psychrotolerans]
MDTHPGLQEHISALADGELAAHELELAFAALDTDAGRQAWQAYRLIGEALRTGQDGVALSAGFEARLARRLAGEAAPAPAAVLATVAPAVEQLDIGIVPQR